MPKPTHALLFLLTAALTACGGGAPGSAFPASSGSISGMVYLTNTVSPVAVSSSGAAQVSSPDLSQVVLGDFILRVRGGARPAPVVVEGVTLSPLRELALEGTWLLRAPDFDVNRTQAVLSALRARPDVEFAESDLRVARQATPNDPRFKDQWHYPALKLPQAWDTTKGTNTTVAVIDSGILYSETDTARRHPDLVNKVLPGYDFISDPTVALDGDGRDADAYDPGDQSGKQSSYHGSHVAGIIAAATDNGAGVAGVNWHARILPVRTLGAKGTGVLSDVIDGLLWSVGKPVKGVAANAHPAAVVNLSLGGKGDCSSALQATLEAVNAAGAITVAAAGNDGADASGIFPANCQNVLVVGATNKSGNRTSYSNYGTPLDVMAPGGDSAGAVLSLGYDDSTRKYSYTLMAGTSMAAPHVAGAVSLLKAQRPDLTLAQAEEILAVTASPLSATACGRPSGSECGAGLVDAAKAVMQASAAPASTTTKTFVRVVYMQGGVPDPTRSKTLDLGLFSGSAPYAAPSLAAGQYAVSAFTDSNGNGVHDSGEPLAHYPALIELSSGRAVSGVNLALPVQSSP